MLRQLIKIMWHRKGKNFLLLTEIFFSFIVLFATATLGIDVLRNFFIPAGFDYEDVYVLSIEYHGEKNASAIEKIRQIKREAEALPEVASLSLSSFNTPYSFQNMSTDTKAENGEKTVLPDIFYVDPTYFETMDMELASGRFLEKGDIGSVKPVVINEFLNEQLFPGESPLGKRITNGGETLKVIGVVKSFRQNGEFSSSVGGVFQLLNLKDTSGHIPTRLMMEIRPNAGLAWQSQLIERANKIAGDWTFEINSLTENRSGRAKFTLAPIIALSIVCGFLIFNVALGLFGVLWYNINKRFPEIGIRRAVGATQKTIRIQMVMEVIVLTTFGILLGLLLAVQFPLLGVFNVESAIYLQAMLVSLISIYLLVAFCAWYPSSQASSIEPAEALHYE